MSNDTPIVVVVFDDSLDDRQLGDYGLSPQEIAPRLIRERARRHEFVNAHTASPTCHASRTAFMSGVHPIESGILNSGAEHTYASAAVPLPWIHQWFAERGWRTESWGKVFHTQGAHGPPPAGFSRVREPGPHARPNEDRSGIDGLLWGASRDAQPDERMVDELTPRLDVLAEREVLFIGLTSTHVPAAPPAEYLARIDADRITIPKPIATPTGLAGLMVGGQAMLAQIVEEDLQKDFIRHYLATIRFADEQLGRILDALPAGTRTVITSDHGWSVGERGGIKKGQVWSQVTQVPLVVDAPDVYPSREKTRHPISLVRLPEILKSFLSGVPISTSASDVAVVAFEKQGVQARSVCGRDFTLIHHFTESLSEYELYYSDDYDQQFNVMVDPMIAPALAARGAA